MDIAAKKFVGKYDFFAFMSSGSSVEDTVRDIKYFDVKRDGDKVIVTVAADGFLYNMVRILVGTLVEVSTGKISVDDIPKIIESKERKRAGFTAPPQGLYLNKVVY
jgi:tRNA pseudouridine38-40 synthase